MKIGYLQKILRDGVGKTFTDDSHPKFYKAPFASCTQLQQTIQNHLFFPMTNANEFEEIYEEIPIDATFKGNYFDIESEKIGEQVLLTEEQDKTKHHLPEPKRNVNEETIKEELLPQNNTILPVHKALNINPQNITEDIGIYNVKKSRKEINKCDDKIQEIEGQVIDKVVNKEPQPHIKQAQLKEANTYSPVEFIKGEKPVEYVKDEKEETIQILTKDQNKIPVLVSQLEATDITTPIREIQVKPQEIEQRPVNEVDKKEPQPHIKQAQPKETKTPSREIQAKPQQTEHKIVNEVDKKEPQPHIKQAQPKETSTYSPVESIKGEKPVEYVKDEKEETIQILTKDQNKTPVLVSQLEATDTTTPIREIQVKPQQTEHKVVNHIVKKEPDIKQVQPKRSDKIPTVEVFKQNPIKILKSDQTNPQNMVSTSAGEVSSTPQIKVQAFKNGIGDKKAETKQAQPKKDDRISTFEFVKEKTIKIPIINQKRSPNLISQFVEKDSPSQGLNNVGQLQHSKKANFKEKKSPGLIQSQPPRPIKVLPQKEKKQILSHSTIKEMIKGKNTSVESVEDIKVLQRPIHHQNPNTHSFTGSLKKNDIQMSKILKDIALIHKKLDEHLNNEKPKPTRVMFLPKRPASRNLGGWNNFERNYIR